jgi:TolB-like protein
MKTTSNINMTTLYKILGAFCALILAVNTSYALGLTSVSVTVTGTGTSYQLAVYDALNQAIAQTEGGKILTESEFHSLAAEAATTEDGKETSTTLASDKMVKKVSVKTEGRVAGYEVREKRNPGAARWEVDLDVKLTKYNTKVNGAVNKRTLAIVPFHLHNSYQLDGFKLNRAAIGDRLKQRIVTAFVQSRRFAVVDRDFVDEFKKEAELIRSKDVNPAELARLGNVLGADYLLVGTVEDLTGKVVSSFNQYTQRTTTQYVGSAIVSYRLFLAATRETKWSETVRVDLSTQPGNTIDERLDAALSDVAWKIAAQVVEVIYPIKIVTTNAVSGEVILNRGGGWLIPGEQFSAMTASGDLIDPDTGEKLGKQETLTAVLEITRVDAKVSYSRVIQGRIGDLKAGDIVHRRAFVPPPVSQAESSSAVPPAPGVKLPFDK